MGIGIIIMIAAVILSEVAIVRGFKALESIAGVYGNGVDLGVTSLEELEKLVNETLGVSMPAQITSNTWVSVKGQTKVHKLYLSGSIVMIEYPDTCRSLSKFARTFKAAVLHKRISQANEANRIMDALVRRVNPDMEAGTITREKQGSHSGLFIWGSWAMIIVGFFVFCAGVANIDINTVKDEHPTSYPNQTYGEAFDEFFNDPEWSNPADRVVEFDGQCLYGGEVADVCIQFTIDADDESFEVTYYSIDDEPQNLWGLAKLMTKVFEDKDLTYEDLFGDDYDYDYDYDDYDYDWDWY